MYYIAALSMKKTKRKYSLVQQGSAIFMILALLWLTVSIPFVYENQQQQALHNQMANPDSPLSGNEEETNPFSNTTEEKTPSSTSFSEEYLHDHHIEDHFFSIAPTRYKCENADTYIAFHGELLVPPPDLS
jgi:hypothetical protein